MEAESERLYEGSAVEITVRFEGELAQGVIINGMIEALTMDNSGTLLLKDDDQMILLCQQMMPTSFCKMDLSH